MPGPDTPPSSAIPFVLLWAILGVLAGTAMLVPLAKSLRVGSLGAVTAAMSVTITAMTFVLLAARFGPTAAIGPGTALAVIGPPLAVVDLAERRLPTSLTLAGFVLGGVALLLAASAAGDSAVIGFAALVSVGVGASYLALAVVSAGGLGAGDVKVAALTGLLLSATGWWSVLVASTVTWLSAALAAVALRAVRSDRSDSTVPLGPFLLAGALVGALDLPSWNAIL